MSNLKVGMRVKIEGTILGCWGAEGLRGYVTDEEDNDNGLLDYEEGVNVKTYHNGIWRVNKSAVIEIA